MKPISNWAVATVLLFATVLLVGLKFIWHSRRLDVGTEVLEGVRDLTSIAITLVRIPFSTAHLQLRAGHTQRLAWQCDVTAGSVHPHVVVDAGIATLDLESLKIARCLISLPTRTGVEIRGESGHMEIEKPSTDLDIAMNNGKVQILADPKRAYDYDVNVKNGLHDFFPHSNNPNAVKVRVNVTNGMVKKQ